jgi:hypothetical protein
MHGAINVKSPNNTSKWQMEFNLAFKGLISCTVHGYLPTAEHKYSLMHYTKLISEEHFTAGRPLVIMLPLAEESTTNEEVGYLIQ